MQIQVLGCQGGIGEAGATTAFLINQDTLIDAGSGLGHLSSAQLAEIRQVFLTHAHLDHIAFLPFLLDSQFEHFQYHPLQVFALAEVQHQLQAHIFNWHIWPDFSRLPDENAPVMHWHPIKAQQKLRLDGLQITPFALQHVVPCVGYVVQDAQACVAVCGDTGGDDTALALLTQHLQGYQTLDAIIIECALPDHLQALARQSGHMTPLDIKHLHQGLPQIAHFYISHLKPRYAQAIRDQLAMHLPVETFTLLQEGDLLTFHTSERQPVS
ncbi:Beta-lactamase superfamily domain-containing protein [Allopseudospirillum japonicum]|uniref:Beta-lactamase superfamily domain-containing protein n=1 Tax=Allopseudospirillum japonicum TaxID=64971 RepID=A0A1H6QY36_9GAMM|nr:3',5'-cyclic-nucleotide phosphodiesterase [Allopseudospirillum japonicum]SEI44410.1 Beta-lactamase superfamily domain-containing protein [Allopseudospirillum japonicum]